MSKILKKNHLAGVGWGGAGWRGGEKMQTTVIEQQLKKMLKRKKRMLLENQDGGVGRHTAPSRTTRKSNSKEVQHQGDKK